MLPKNIFSSSSRFSSRNKARNSLSLNTNSLLKNNTAIQKDTSPREKTLKFRSNSVFSTITNDSKNKNRNKNTRIYLRLDIKDEIEKIIQEEEKKRYFNQEFHLNKNINREELQKRIGNKIPFEEISKKKLRNNKNSPNNLNLKIRPKTSFKKKGFKTTRNLININKRLFENFKSKDEKEIEESKKNYEMVNDFIKKMDEENWRKFNEIEKKYLKLKSEEQNSHYDLNKSKEKNKEEDKMKTIENLRIKESDFIKFKKKMMIKEKKYIKQKSEVFDNILKYDFRNYYPTRNEDPKFQTVNYRLLSRTILMRNLMKQMKITVYKDETLNVLRGFQSLKIANLNNDKFKLGDQDIYTNQNDNMFFLGNNMRNKPVPHFLKVKFSIKTTKKFGEVNGSYFGLPV